MVRRPARPVPLGRPGHRLRLPGTHHGRPRRRRLRRRTHRTDRRPVDRLPPIAGDAASPETLHRLADAVRALTGELTGRRRPPGEIPEVDEFPGGVRMYSPVTGAGSPIAPPMAVTPLEDGVLGRCLLGIAHEGPPGYGHGGVSAMLVDELMGWACAAAGHPGMTISLQTQYRRPVPLETPLRVRARVMGTDDRKVFVTGSITTEEDASTVLVEGDGVFLALAPDHARDLFPALRA
ncbi:PaaI family thioesterase [Streptomyces sp. ISL-36]|nr:PaaI family thioesterase [Streptomyces sp. ISL-36]